MSRYSESMWETDVKAQIQRLAMVYTSLKSGAMEVYLDALEFCTVKGVTEAVNWWLKTSDAPNQIPKPGQILSKVPAGEIDNTDGKLLLSGWDNYGNLFGPWAAKEPPICDGKQAQAIADFLGEFWNYRYPDKVLEMFEKLGVEAPKEPIKQEQMDLSA